MGSIGSLGPLFAIAAVGSSSIVQLGVGFWGQVGDGGVSLGTWIDASCFA
jgi:hypothetical protein